MKHFITVIFLSTFNLNAHVVDIHIKTPMEIVEEERQEKDYEISRDRRVFEDEENSEQERREALARLVENEEVL